MLVTVWKYPTPELPTALDRYLYRATRARGAWWHPSLLLSEAQVAALRDAVKGEEGQAWLNAKGAREAALAQALLGSFIKHSLEDTRPEIPPGQPWVPPEPLPPEPPRFIRRPKESAHERYERRAKEWDEAGRPFELELEGEELATLVNWVPSDGAKRDGVSNLLQTFLAQSQAGYRGLAWYHHILAQRSYCGTCGESFRVENLMLCTNCTRNYCHQCMYARNIKAPNGNIACPCGNGELVG